MGSSRRAVFLDRDGVLTESIVVEGRPLAPLQAVDLVILPGVAEACVSLHDAGFLLIVVTNQPEVARGNLQIDEMDAMNIHLSDVLPLEEILVCLHDDGDNCNCRKPKPGLLLDAAARHSIALESCFMVGDRWRDIDAGRAAGCTTAYIDRGYAEKKADRPNYTATSLQDVAAWILESPSP